MAAGFGSFIPRWCDQRLDLGCSDGLADNLSGAASMAAHLEGMKMGSQPATKFHSMTQQNSARKGVSEVETSFEVCVDWES